MTRGKRKNRKSAAQMTEHQPGPVRTGALGGTAADPIGVGDHLVPKPWTGDKQAAAVEMLTKTGRHRAEPYTSVIVNEDALKFATLNAEKDAQIEALRAEITADQALLDKVRDRGVSLTVDGEQIRLPETLTSAEARTLYDRMKRTPRHYTVGMARPSGLPLTRDMMLAHLEYEGRIGVGVKPLHFDQPKKWEMYFATADFASLFQEMQRDFRDEQIDDYLSDILEEWGPSGQIIVGFDLNRVPIVRVSKHANQRASDAALPPDNSVWDVPGETVSRASLGALAFQWRTNLEGATAIFGGLRTTGDTFRTCGVGSESTRDVLLIVWMLSSKSLRMLEATTQKASAGLPPHAKDKKRAIREDTVTVVTLRRHVREQVEQVQHAESGRHLQHRFVVRGHWRNQAYGTNRALRRRTYILPYVKGPDGAPFVEREKVFQW